MICHKCSPPSSATLTVKIKNMEVLFKYSRLPLTRHVRNLSDAELLENPDYQVIHI